MKQKRSLAWGKLGNVETKTVINMVETKMVTSINETEKCRNLNGH